MIKLTVVGVDDSVLQENIILMSRATGRTVKEQTRLALKGMVRRAFEITPPASQNNTGKRAQRIGELAISGDLHAMGFTPVTIKGHRTITKAFGHPITPVTVATKILPSQLSNQGEVDLMHRLRLASTHRRGGRRVVTRGRKQAWYVDRKMITSMLTRLYAEVGRLSAGWLTAARQLGITPPAWVSRHDGAGRGTEVQIVETATTITMEVVNFVPDKASDIASAMRRQIAFLKTAALGDMKRQLERSLTHSIRAAKKN